MSKITLLITLVTKSHDPSTGVYAGVRVRKNSSTPWVEVHEPELCVDGMWQILRHHMFTKVSYMLVKNAETTWRIMGLSK